MSSNVRERFLAGWGHRYNACTAVEPKLKGATEVFPMNMVKSPQSAGRIWIARGFTAVEDIVYICLGLLLAGIAFTLLVIGVIDFLESVRTEKIATIHLLDRILLILLVVELLYTVQVSFREHALVPEPFLLVGVISVIRRVLVLTAEHGELREKSEIGEKNFFIELAVLTALILALAISLVLLRKKGTPAAAENA
jgi:uncharacterized membrane protein (DUF373 family)